MSLDIYLIEEKVNKCPHCGKEISVDKEEVYSTNITHNLNTMAHACGLYELLWNCKELTQANKIITQLQVGHDLLKANPEKYKEYNSSNGWGIYEDFLWFVDALLKACKNHPKAFIEISK